jgi:hypothetical protein
MTVVAGQEECRLARAVQRNCDIADARHAREATMCTYLLQLRELYCWEHGLPLARAPEKEAFSRWLAEREARWATLEGAQYDALPLGPGPADPFDADTVNRALAGRALVYSAGYGRFRRAHFFLAALAREETRDGVRVLVAGRELARDLGAPLAALQAGTIYVRREGVRRWLWDKLEFWRSRGVGGAHGYASASDEAAFERIVDAETETLVLHELGESRAAALLGPAWEEMLARLEDRRAELLARAVRDNLADCLTTLPALLEREAHASIHFWFAQFDGLRRELFPSLLAAYRDWSERGAARSLARALVAGAAHWERIARRFVSVARPAADPHAFVL